MGNMFEGAEINIYTTDGTSFSFDLSPIQLKAVCGILGLEYNGNGTMNCFSDKGLETFYSKTVGRFKEVK